MEKISKNNVRTTVMENYKAVALKYDAKLIDCCTADTNLSVVSEQLGYSADEYAAVPVGSNMGIGCGNPQAIASIKPGETVLDLGSGGGFDCFLAAKSVGEFGTVIGVDMTAEMIVKAMKNAEKGGYSNTEFRLGEIENLPVANNVVDVIISNCVINLSPEKEKVFNEAFRVLKSGGRLAISDIVATAEIPESIKNNDDFLCGCISGASSIESIYALLVAAGFSEINIQPKDKSVEFIKDWVPGSGIENLIISATIEAVKP